MNSNLLFTNLAYFSWIIITMGVGRILSIPTKLNSPAMGSPSISSGESLISNALSLSSPQVNWNPNDLNVLKTVSRNINTDISEYNERQSAEVWNIVQRSCSHNSMIFVREYFMLTRELHLSLDYISNMYADGAFKLCMDAIDTAKASIFVENIWFHINKVDTLKAKRFTQTLANWRRSSPNYFIFKFPDTWWEEFASKEFNNPSPVHLFMNAYQLGQMQPKVWAAFAYPTNMDTVENLTGSNEMRITWAVPYFNWRILYKIAMQNINLFIPLPLTVNQKKHDILGVLGYGPFKATWSFGSPHLNSHFKTILHYLKRLFFVNQVLWDGKLSLTVPRTAFSYRLDYQTNKKLPPQWFFNEIFSNIMEKLGKHVAIISNDFVYNYNSKKLTPMNVNVVDDDINDSFTIDFY